MLPFLKSSHVAVQALVVAVVAGVFFCKWGKKAALAHLIPSVGLPSSTFNLDSLE